MKLIRTNNEATYPYTVHLTEVEAETICQAWPAGPSPDDSYGHVMQAVADGLRNVRPYVPTEGEWVQFERGPDMWHPARHQPDLRYTYVGLLHYDYDQPAVHVLRRHDGRYGKSLRSVSQKVALRPDRRFQEKGDGE